MHFFETLKTNSQETAQNFLIPYLFYKSEKNYFLTPINPWTPIIFFKNIIIVVP
jgi:hypothetical protein